jgi:hypothetical protein
MACMIRVALCASGAGPHRTAPGIDADPLHHPKVDHKAIIAAPETAAIMTAAANSDKKAILSTEIDRRNDVRGRLSIIPL